MTLVTDMAGKKVFDFLWFQSIKKSLRPGRSSYTVYTILPVT